MRRLTEIEEGRLKALTKYSVEVTLIEPTETGLKKSIMDATTPVQRYLSENSIHDYNEQKQGLDYKIVINSYLVGDDMIIPSRASLYRPVTKKGDPRIWFKGLPGFTSPNDVLALIINDDEIYVLNISKTNIEDHMEKRQSGPIWDLLCDINNKASSTSEELLAKIRSIAMSGPVKTVTDMKADTGIGRTLESMLGIDINSSKKPDYKGIELKSFRTQGKGRENRKTLFAQVPNWELSKFKRSKEILENFGYERGGDFKLYCEVSTKVKNSQGLQLELDQKTDQLLEISDKKEIGAFATWMMADLRRRLLEKHNETFWVVAQSSEIDGNEHFQFTKVLHTRKPIASQFDILVDQGAITMDHLIKRTPTGGAKEKGPLFKIEAKSLEMLFPPGITYDLMI